jgi:hypothetical protein
MVNSPKVHFNTTRLARSWAQRYLYLEIQKSSKQIYQYHKIIYSGRSLQQLCANFGTEARHTIHHNISKIQLKSLGGFCRNTNISISHFYFSSKN